MLLFLRCPRHLSSDERVLVTSMSSLDSVRDGLKFKICQFDLLRDIPNLREDLNLREIQKRSKKTIKPSNSGSNLKLLTTFKNKYWTYMHCWFLTILIPHEAGHHSNVHFYNFTKKYRRTGRKLLLQIKFQKQSYQQKSLKISDGDVIPKNQVHHSGL